MKTRISKNIATVIGNCLTVIVCCLLVMALAACSDDNDSNPWLTTPSEFTLNVPAYANMTVDLQHTDSMQLSWSQPRYTADFAPLPLTYEILVSLTDQFTTSLDEADLDLSGQTKADYAAIARTTTYCNYTLIAADLNQLLMQLGGWTAETFPETVPVYLRVNAFVQENLKRLSPKQSNSITLNVTPFFEEIKYTPPVLWYMVGDFIGSKAWGNDGVGAIGTGIVPMFLKSGERYDRTTGAGLITFTTYVPEGKKFRMVATPGTWDNDHGWDMLIGSEDDPNDFTNYVEEADDKNILFKQGGYYTFTAHTGDMTLRIEKLDITPAVYDKLCVAGTMNDWSDTEMTPVFTLESQENHVWMTTVNGGDKLKVKLPGSWDKNWGYQEGLQGTGDGDGNLVVPDGGEYLLLFNDLTGDYLLIER